MKSYILSTIPKTSVLMFTYLRHAQMPDCKNIGLRIEVKHTHCEYQHYIYTNAFTLVKLHNNNISINISSNSIKQTYFLNFSIY